MLSGKTRVAAWAGLLLMAGLGAEAATFRYQAGEVLAGFRQAGASYELVVDLGPVTNLLAVAPGAVVRIERVRNDQITNAFPTLDGLSWSVSAAVTLEEGVDGAAYGTLWLTRSRKDPASEVEPWLRKSVGSQLQSATRIESVGSGAGSYASSTPSDPVFNTPDAVILPSGGHFSYSAAIGSRGNWQNTFQGNCETISGEGFSAGEAVGPKADWFVLVPLAPGEGAGPGVRVGTFELRRDGSLWFTRAGGQVPPGPIPQPVIRGIEQLQGFWRVAFTTTNDASVTYALRYQDVHLPLASPRTWLRGGTTVQGDGSVKAIDLVPEGTGVGRIIAVEASR